MEDLKISVVYIQTKEMVADLLTKAVSKATFDHLVGPSEPSLDAVCRLQLWTDSREAIEDRYR